MAVSSESRSIYIKFCLRGCYIRARAEEPRCHTQTVKEMHLVWFLAVKVFSPTICSLALGLPKGKQIRQKDKRPTERKRVGSVCIW